MPDTEPQSIPTALHGPVWEWSRRLLIAAALALAVWLLVAVSGRSNGRLETGSKDPVAQTRYPLPDGHAPLQSPVGVVLVDGYDGTMFINGVQIPEAELDGALDPNSKDKSVQDLIAERGLRPNNRNRVFFTPGSSKTFEKLPSGKVVVTINYHLEYQPTVGTGTVSWTFTAQ